MTKRSIWLEEPAEAEEELSVEVADALLPELTEDDEGANEEDPSRDDEAPSDDVSACDEEPGCDVAATWEEEPLDGASDVEPPEPDDDEEEELLVSPPPGPHAGDATPARSVTSQRFPTRREWVFMVLQGLGAMARMTACLVAAASVRRASARLVDRGSGRDKTGVLRGGGGISTVRLPGRGRVGEWRVPPLV